MVYIHRPRWGKQKKKPKTSPQHHYGNGAASALTLSGQKGKLSGGLRGGGRCDGSHTDKLSSCPAEIRAHANDSADARSQTLLSVITGATVQQKEVTLWQQGPFKDAPETTVISHVFPLLLLVLVDIILPCCCYSRSNNKM